MALILRGDQQDKLTTGQLDGNFTHLLDLINQSSGGATGPAGATGPQGAVGATGPQGATGPGSTSEYGDFYTDVVTVPSGVEQTLKSFKVDANTYKVGDILSTGQSIFVSGVILSDLAGWDDLSNVLLRSYDNFRNANNGQIGNYVIGTEFIMRETTTGRYWKIIFSSWTQGSNGGGFSYQRTEINPNTGNEISETISFTKSDYEDVTDIIIPGVLEISRGEDQGIYNSALEESYDKVSYISPENTQWNSIFLLDFEDSYSLKCYWSYNQNGRDNLIGEYIDDNVNFGSIFSANPNFTTSGSGSGSGSGEALVTKIETPTTLRTLTNQSFTDISIPDIERDIYFTITGQSDSQLDIRINFISVIKNTFELTLYYEFAFDNK